MKFQTEKELYKAAIDVQDACNSSGVVHLLKDMLSYLVEQGGSTNANNQHAAVRLVIAKLADLSHLTIDLAEFKRAYDICREQVPEPVKPELCPEVKSYLRLQIDSPDFDYVNSVVEFAKRRGLLLELQEQLTYLNGYAQERSKGCRVWKDFAPYSFSFLMLDAQGKSWFNGGLIYFGKGDTGVDGPQYSVRLGDSYEEGWSVHT